MSILGRKLIWLSVVLTATLGSGAGSSTGADEIPSQTLVKNAQLIADSQLRAAVEDYYMRESTRDWRATYGYRRKEFHDLVPFDAYVKTMESDSAGVTLEELEILEVTEKTVRGVGAAMEIGILFREYVTEGTRLKLACQPARDCSHGVSTKTKSATLWIRREERWKCLDCGRWATFGLNLRMVEP